MIPSVSSEFNTTVANPRGLCWLCRLRLALPLPRFGEGSLGSPGHVPWGRSQRRRQSSQGIWIWLWERARAERAAAVDICMCASSQSTGMHPRPTLSSLSQAIHRKKTAGKGKEKQRARCLGEQSPGQKEPVTCQNRIQNPALPPPHSFPASSFRCSVTCHSSDGEQDW